MSEQIHNQVEQFFSQFTQINFKKDETIIHAGESPQGIYYLQAGLVKMTTITRDGEELTFNIFKPGSFFPMNWAINQTPNTYNFQCITDITAFRAPPQDVIDYLKANPDILLDLTSRIYTGMWGLMDQMQYLMHGNAEAKITNILLMLIARLGKTNPDGSITIDIPLTHQDIASLAGTSRETVTRYFSNLKKQHILTTSQHTITIADIQLLEQ